MGRVVIGMDTNLLGAPPAPMHVANRHLLFQPGLPTSSGGASTDRPDTRSPVPPDRSVAAPPPGLIRHRTCRCGDVRRPRGPALDMGQSG
jgi:hypothetical protein